MRAEDIREMCDGGHRRRGSPSSRRSGSASSSAAATEPLEDPLRLRVIRKDIARLKTDAARETAESPSQTRASKRGGARWRDATKTS